MELNIEYIFILCVLYINDIGDDLMNNHMEIPWHEYTNKDSKVKIENASLTEKILHYRKNWIDAFSLWYRCLASKKFNEHHC